MKHKSKQVLELEKALGFELSLRDDDFRVDGDGYIIGLNITESLYYQKNFAYRWLFKKPTLDIKEVLPLINNVKHLRIGISIVNEEYLSHLVHLRDFGLTGNNVAKIDFLKNLNQIDTLTIVHNSKLANFDVVKYLENLKELHISYCNLKEIKYVGLLKKLTSLLLSNNLLENIEGIEDLNRLEFLNLGYNNIKSVEPLSSLKRVKSLHINSNEIEDLTPIASLFRDLKISKEGQSNSLSVLGNPLKTPPEEVIKQGNEAVVAYFEEQEKVKNSFKIGVEITDKVDVPLNEVRVIFLGQGQTGKTTLKKQLLGLEIPETETQTDGIDIDVWQPEALDGIKLRLWDFGGQEIQHSVHKLFLQDNCVYVLLINKRQDQQSDGHLIYWLNHIRSFGKNSPVIIVENFIDTVSGVDATTTPEQIANQVSLRNEIKQNYHSETAPLDYVGISAKRGYNIEMFKEKLFHWATQENNRGQYSPRWLAAKDHIEERITGGTEFGGLARNNYITKETFDLECEQVEIVDPNAQDTILGVMLRLGVAFYFKKSENRKNWLVLNPEWVTVGIYSLILHPKVKELNGRLLRSDLEEILVNEDGHSFFSKKDYTYSEDELGYLLGLMQDYELCYTPDGTEYFLPTGFVQNYNSQFKTENPKAVAFLIQYDTLPQAIWFKFLVRLFKRKIVRKYWQEGIEVAAGNAIGLVEFLPLLEKKIKIWVSGKTDDARIELLRLLRYELDFVNEEFSNIQLTPKLFTEDKSEINYSDVLAALYQNEPIKQGFEKYNPLPMIAKVDAPEQTFVNLFRELQRVSLKVDDFISNKDGFLIDIAEQLEKSGVVNLIVNNNINENINIVKTRFELPRETNALEGKLNFLIEELKDKENEKKLLQELLEKIEELRLVPTKEEAVKRGFYERFKKFGEYLKTGTDLTKSLKEIGNMVSVEEIKQGIDLILESMK